MMEWEASVQGSEKPEDDDSEVDDCNILDHTIDSMESGMEA
jgi:hypothetical protein